MYERIVARRQRRKPQDLYHTALEVVVDGERLTIENAWPSPDGEGNRRGVVREGPVFSRRLARFRLFRYEVRCWSDGVIPDAGYAVGGPQRVTSDPDAARALRAGVSRVPDRVWGRDEAGAGEMWNSNSVVAWLLVTAAIDPFSVAPPESGRVPGWEAGVAAAS